MRYEFELHHIPAGFAKESADGGEKVSVITRHFATDQSGDMFYHYLQGLQSPYLRQFIDAGNLVSTIDHCLVLIDKNRKVRVFINELAIKLTGISRKNILSGEIVNIESAFAGLTNLEFLDLVIPEDEGIIFFFSVGWRRGIFFDFRPIHPESPLKHENIGKTLAICYELLLFNEVYSLDEARWAKLYSLGWFPFIAFLGDDTFKHMLLRIGENKAIEPLEAQVFEKFDKQRFMEMLDRFSKRDFLRPHLPFIQKGIEHYLAGDYISSISALYPRIEGILRIAFTREGKRPTQKDLLDLMQGSLRSYPQLPEIFLPEHFKDYLLRYYFKDFDVSKNKLEVSRHSLGHGVSSAATYDQKRALIGILMVEQLSYYFGLPKSEQTKSTTQ